MEYLKTKKELFEKLVIENKILSCPICNTLLKKSNLSSLTCKNRHDFNINKKGFIRLLSTSKKYDDTTYTKDLFLKRRDILKKGYYSKVYDIICKEIEALLKNNYILFEIGAGEATHSFFINQKIKNKHHYFVSDLSAEAIKMATDYLDVNICPIVCDAYNLPVIEKSIDCVIDILSPYYYKEVYRVLKDDGIFIKVTPTKTYLKEIRELARGDSYENEEEVRKNIASHFEIVNSYIINETFELSESAAKAFIAMTPLTKNSNLTKLPKNITIGLNIIIAKKEKNIQKSLDNY